MSEQRWANYYAQHMERKASPTLRRALSAFTEIPPNAQAIDLGCGTGNDTLELLSHGWRVLAIDSNPTVPDFFSAPKFDVYRKNLTILCEPFETCSLPQAQLINAHYSIPFCSPANFDSLWSKISDATKFGGRFSGNFFGPQDEWATNERMTFLCADQTRALFTGWEIEVFNEVEHDSPTAAGPIKHWHIIDVMARNIKDM